MRQVLRHVIEMQRKQLQQHFNYQASSALAIDLLASFELQKQQLLCYARYFVGLQPFSLVLPSIVQHWLHPLVMQICSRMVPKLLALLVVVEVEVVAVVVHLEAQVCLQRGQQEQEQAQEEQGQTVIL